MNKIFKVVWSKTKECYVVVSEVAKNNGGKKKVLASVLAGLAMVGAGAAGTPVQAADMNSDQSANTKNQINIWANTTTKGNPAAGGSGASGSGVANANDVKPSQYGDEISIAIGGQNSINTTDATSPGSGGSGYAIGNKNKIKGNRNVALGTENKTYGDDSIAIGNKTVSGTGHGIAIGSINGTTQTVAYGTANPSETASSAFGFALAIGSGAQADGRANSASGGIAIGQMVKSTNNNTVAIGVNTTASGNNAVAIGSGAQATQRISTAYGPNANANSAGGVAIGTDAVVGTDTGLTTVIAGATAVGANAQAQSTSGSAFGRNAKADKNAENATALGAYATANIAGGVALGSNSVTTTAAGVPGYNPANGRTNKYSDQSGAIGTSTLAAVSVGNGLTATRQITGLAAGTADTDAVNVAQLKNVNLKYAGDSTQVTGSTDVRLNDGTFNVNGDGTIISTEATATGIKVTAKVGGTINANTDGKVVAPATNGIATTTNVTDAINKSGWNIVSSNNGGSVTGTQATKLVNPGSTVTLSAGKNIVLDQNDKKFTYSLSDTVALTNAGSLTVGDTKVNNGGVTITAPTGGTTTDVKLTNTGLDNGGNKIVNVKDGDVSATSKDAVNGSQLHAVAAKERHIAPTTATHAAYTVDNNGDVTLDYVDGDGAATSEKAVIKGVAKQDLSNITNAGKQVITGLSNKVVAGDNITVDETEDATTKQKTYKVNAKLAKLEDGTNTTVTGDGTTGNAYHVNVAGDLTGISSITNGGTNNGKISFGPNKTVTVDGDHSITLNASTGTIGGLQNKTFDPTNITSGQAATEDQLKSVHDTLKASELHIAPTASTLTNEHLGGTASGNTATGAAAQAYKYDATTKQVVLEYNDGNGTNKTGTKAVIDFSALNTGTGASSWNIASDKVSTTEGTVAAGSAATQNIADGKTVTMKAGKNLTVKQENVGGNASVAFSLDKDLTNLDKVVVNGENGTNGKDGVTIIGPQGATGATGMPGTNGIDGKVGITGKDGKDAVSIAGKDGVGTIGLTGPQGPAGTNGKSVDISTENGTQTLVKPEANNNNQSQRIVYVPKDANGNPLKDDAGNTIKREVATMDDGLKFTGNNESTVNKHNLGSLVKVQGEGTKEGTNAAGTKEIQTSDGTKFESAKDNIAVEANNGDTLTVKLNKNLKGLDAVQTKTVELGDHTTPGSTTNITYNPTDKRIEYTTPGTTQTKKVATTDDIWTIQGDGTDVAPVGGKVNVKAGENILITTPTTADGSMTINAVTPAVYTDKNGNKLTKDKDGKFHKPDGTEVQPADVITSIQDATGNVTGGNSIVNNVGSAIKNAGNAGDSFLTKLDAANTTTPNAAVNVSDLKNTADGLTNKGLRFDANEGNEKINKLGSKVTVKGTGALTAGKAYTDEYNTANIRTKIEQDTDGNTTINVGLAKALKDINSISNGNSSITISDVPTGATTPAVTISGGNLSMGNGTTNNKIVNLAPGTGDNDAVNVKQLKDTELHITPGTYTPGADKKVKLTYTDGNNAVVTGKEAVIDLSGLSTGGTTASSWNVKSSANTTDGGAVADNHNANAQNIADGKSVEFQSGKNLVVKQTNDTANGNATVEFSLSDNITAGKNGANGKDGSVGVTGKDGSSVVINGADGSIGMTGPKGQDGKDGINGRDGANLSMTSAKGEQVLVNRDPAHNADTDKAERIVYVPKDASGNPIQDANGKNIVREVATMDDGLKFTGNNTTIENKQKLGSLVKVQGEGTKEGTTVINTTTGEKEIVLSDGTTKFESAKDNIAVVADGTDTLTVKLNKNIKGLDSVQTKTVVLGDPSVTNGTTNITYNPTEKRIEYVTPDAAGTGTTTNKVANLADELHIQDTTYTIGDTTKRATAAKDEVTLTYKDGNGNEVADKYAIIKGVANSDLSNISDAGKKNITKLGSIVKAGDNVTVSEASDATTGQKTYTVNAVTPAVYTKADGTKVIKRPDGTFTTNVDGAPGNDVPASDVIVSFQDAAGNRTGGNSIVNNVGSAIDKPGTATGNTFLTQLDNAATTTPFAAVNVRDLKTTADALKANERHIAPTTVATGSTETKGGTANAAGTANVYKYDAASKTVTLTYNDGNGNAVTDTKAVIDLSNLSTGGTGASSWNVKSSANTTDGGAVDANHNANAQNIADGKSVEFQSGKNLVVKQTNDTTNGNATVEFSLSDNITVGKDGVNGKDGSVGAKGADGSAVVMNGKDGSIGLNGTNGANGISIKGKDGANGVGIDGKDGVTRIVYTEKVPDPANPGTTKEVTHEVATMDDGLKFTGNNTGTVNKHKLGSLVKVQGEGVTAADEAAFQSASGNIAVTADGTDKLTIRLNKNLKGLNSIQLGGNTIQSNGDNITFTTNGGTTKTVATTDQLWTIQAGGVDVPAKSGKVNLVAGDHITITPDAANGKMTISATGFGSMDGFNVKTSADANGTHAGDTTENIKNGKTVDMQAGKNLVVTQTNDGNGNTTVNYALNKDVDLGTNGSLKTGDTTINNDGFKNGNTTVGGNGMTIKDPTDPAKTVSLTKDGLNNGGNQITNVASGGNVDTNAANIGDIKRLAKDTRIKDGTYTVDNNGTVELTYVDGNGNQVKDASGNAITAKITGLTTLDSTRVNVAVNETGSGKAVGSKAAVKVTKGTEFVAGDNLIVERKANAGTDVDNSVVYSLNKDLKGIETIQNGDNTKITLHNVPTGATDPTAVTINGGNINMGGNRIVNVAPAKAGTDAVNLDQLKAARTKVISKDGTVTVTPTEDKTTGQMTYDLHVTPGQSPDLTRITNKVDQLGEEIGRVGAQGAALSALKPIQYDPLEPTQIMAGYGNYRGNSAVALGVAHYKNESTLIHGGVSWAGGSSHMMANAGVTWKVGNRDSEAAVADRYRKGPISSAYAMQQEMAAMKAQNAGLKGEVSDLKAENEQMKAQIAAMMAKLGL